MLQPRHNDSGIRTFSNSTLEGNWYEDRWGEPEQLKYTDRVAKIRDHETALDVSLRNSPTHQVSAKPPHLTRYSKPNTWRTQTVDLCKDASTPYIPDVNVVRVTTKNDADSHLAEVLRPRRTPRMINHLNMRQTIWAQRQTAPPEAGFSAVLPKHGPEEAQGDWKTTTQVFYQDKPTEDRAARPELNAPHSSMYCSAGKLDKDVYTTGNPYGMSVWADDYAKWGTKLAGMRLGDVDSLKTTRHFDA